jgi:hypothetical protein
LNPLYPVVAERAGERCEYCRAPEQVFNFAFEVDHIQPRFAGGSNDFDNLTLACESCNLFKSNATHGRDSTGKHHPLFHPRQDHWTDHFAILPETGEIVGLTEVGRDTGRQLRINSDFQQRARRHWMQLGLYP